MTIDDENTAAITRKLCDAILLHFDADDFPELERDDAHTATVASFAVARTIAVGQLGSDKARAWFQHLIDKHWDDP